MTDGPDPRLDARLPSAPPDLLQALIASVADAIYLVDHEGRVRFVNPAGLAVLGYGAEEELLGQPSHATIHRTRPDGSAYPEAECPLLRPRTTGETVRVEEDWFVRADGSLVPVAYSSAPVPTPAGRGAVVVFRDITVRQAAAAALLRSEAERARAEELQASRARIVAAADAERHRLGRDLHDGAQPRLVHVGLGIRLALGHLDDDPAQARALLTEALDETRRAIEELRDLAAGIHPAILTSRGLRAAIDALVARSPIPVATSVAEQRFPPAIEATAYFVVAEGLANAAKHAAAAGIRVDVARDGDRLVVAVEDDGRGGADPARGSGLHGLRDRVGAVGGTCTVDSPPGGGTRVRAELPL